MAHLYGYICSIIQLGQITNEGLSDLLSLVPLLNDIFCLEINYPEMSNPLRLISQ